MLLLTSPLNKTPGLLPAAMLASRTRPRACAEQGVEQKPPHVRRQRYAGRYPRSFAEKHKERAGDAVTVGKIEAKGNTAVGTHRPICVAEIINALNPQPGHTVVDCTLGFGGHARELLRRVTPGGHLFGFDADGLELRRTEARLEAEFPGAVSCFHRNYAGVAVVLEREPEGVDCLLADLGVSSMQLDDPARGFTFKRDGALDMRLDTTRGAPAWERLAGWNAEVLETLLRDNADEPRSAELAASLVRAHAKSPLMTTTALADAVRAALPRALPAEDVLATTRRVFQALRIAVNDEFAKLDALLLAAPLVVKPGGRLAFLSFHSGEDRRVKLALKAGLQDGLYSEVSELLRPSMAEQRANSRSTSAKLRWAQKA